MLASKQVISLGRSTSVARTREADRPAAELRAVIGRLARLLRPTRAAGALTPTEISVLFAICRDGPLPLASLAEREALNPTMLSRVIGGLTDAGLVTRTVSPDDRRSAHVTATAAGRRLRERIRSERDAVLAEALAALAPAQRRSIEAAVPALEALAERLR
jgi:DNA-binding MarR family transcriptional regulator